MNFHKIKGYNLTKEFNRVQNLVLQRVDNYVCETAVQAIPKISKKVLLILEKF